MFRMNKLKQSLMLGLGIAAAFGSAPALAAPADTALTAQASAQPVFLCLVDDTVIFFVFSEEECDELGGVLL